MERKTEGSRNKKTKIVNRNIRQIYVPKLVHTKQLCNGSREQGYGRWVQGYGSRKNGAGKRELVAESYLLRTPCSILPAPYSLLPTRVAEKSNPSNLDFIQIEISASNLMPKFTQFLSQNGHCCILRLLCITFSVFTKIY